MRRLNLHRAREDQRSHRLPRLAKRSGRRPQLNESVSFGSGERWAAVEKTFHVGFKDRALKDLVSTTLAILEFKFKLPQYTGECQICDVQLLEKAAK